MERDQATLKKEIEAMEENLEYSTVTNLRESLLQIVERFKKEPARRYLILKHGQPQAVLMSFQTYEFLKKVLTQVMMGSREMGREEEIDAAFARLRAERTPARGTAARAVEVGAEAEEAEETPGAALAE